MYSPDSMKCGRSSLESAIVTQLNVNMWTLLLSWCVDGWLWSVVGNLL